MTNILNMILAKLRIENAYNTSDYEIERILSKCVMPTRLIKLAKQYRDQGLLILNKGGYK